VNRRILYFDGDRGVTIRQEILDPPADGEIQVRTITSAISAGTERMMFEGRIPSTMLEDATLDAVGDTSYPMPYGYACVGEVTQVGKSVAETWKGERVFAFHPHADRFNVAYTDAVRLPLRVSSEDAALIPNIETAASLVMDAKPVIGESICLFGCGTVGALCGRLLSQFPGIHIIAIDPDAGRRAQVESYCGVKTATPAGARSAGLEGHNGIAYESDNDQATHRIDGIDEADLILEVSGNPEALSQAIQLAGYGSRIIVGSWYGTRPAELALGAAFHRSHVRIRSSQVSTIDPDHRGRWSHPRRMNLVLNLIEDLQPAQLVTSRRSFTDAAEVYQELSDNPTGQMQILFTY